MTHLPTVPYGRLPGLAPRRRARLPLRVLMPALLVLHGCTAQMPWPVHGQPQVRAAPLQPIPLALFDAPRAAPFETIDAPVRELMRRAGVSGLALALLRGGRIVYVQAYGVAGPASTAQPAPALRADALLHAASLTKAAFAHLALQLVADGLLDLDAPLANQLPRPLAQVPGYADLAADARWQAITLRQLLSHSAGLPNWRHLMPGGRLELLAAPGERYVYSGEGLQLAQLLVEERSGQPLARLMQERVFERFGMRDTRLVWDAGAEPRLAAGFDAAGAPVPMRRPARARAAGSMITTVGDYAAFLAGVLRGQGLPPALQRQMLGAQQVIHSPRQFPSHEPGQTQVNAGIELAAGLGWVVYRSPRGRAFFKDGNDPGTQNLALGFADSGDGLVLMANSGNGDKIFQPLVELLLAPSCLPWFWLGHVPYDQPALRSRAAREQPLGPGETCLRALAFR